MAQSIDVLDELIGSLNSVRRIVADGDRDALMDRLERARAARLNLPSSAPRPSDLVEMRVPIPDRRGEIDCPSIAGLVLSRARDDGHRTGERPIARYHEDGLLSGLLKCSLCGSSINCPSSVPCGTV